MNMDNSVIVKLIIIQINQILCSLSLNLCTVLLKFCDVISLSYG